MGENLFLHVRHSSVPLRSKTETFSKLLGAVCGVRLFHETCIGAFKKSTLAAPSPKLSTSEQWKVA